MTATPTDAERERARDLLFPELANELPHNLARLQFGDEAQQQMERIAQALADRRRGGGPMTDDYLEAVALGLYALGCGLGEDPHDGWQRLADAERARHIARARFILSYADPASLAAGRSNR